MRNYLWNVGISVAVTAALTGTTWSQRESAQGFFGAATQPAATMSQDIQVQKLSLGYVEAEGAAKMINELYEAKGAMGGRTGRLHAVADKARNTVVMVGDSMEIGQCLLLLNDLDKDMLDGGGVYFLYPLRHARAEELAPILRESLNGMEENGEKAFLPRFNEKSLVVADRTRNMLLLSTSTKWEGSVRDIIEKLDQPMPQVRVRVTLMEVKRGEGGIISEGLGKDRAGMSAEEAAGMMKKLESDGRVGRSWRAEVLGITGKEAVLRVGDGEKDGIRVTVMPRVNLAGEVTMDVNDGVAGGGGHRVRTTLRLKSGEIAVAGEFPVAEEGKVGVMLVGATVVKEEEKK